MGGSRSLRWEPLEQLCRRLSRPLRWSLVFQVDLRGQAIRTLPGFEDLLAGSYTWLGSLFDVAQTPLLPQRSSGHGLGA